MSSTSDLVIPTILSGGSGTRLWPLSTDSRPKQFLDLTGPMSMFQLTLERCRKSDIFGEPIVVGAEKHADLAEQQLSEVGSSAQALILEPCARNTAPAIALAALACKSPSALMLIMPSDHLIKNVGAFLQAIKASIPIAKARWLVTFGIEPTAPETGYGYIEQGDKIVGSERSFSANRFVEKPNSENAEKMLAAGGFHWNAGIFLFRADAYLEAMEEFAPEMLAAAKASMEKSDCSDNRIIPDKDCFANAPSDSIDYAIMEKAEKVAVTPMKAEWSDVGSWDSLYQIAQKDDHKNALTGNVATMESSGNLIHADGVSITTYGVHDLIIVANGDDIMIMPRGQSQQVKKIAGLAEKKPNQI